MEQVDYIPRNVDSVLGLPHPQRGEKAERPKALIVSHSYISAENQKNIVALSQSIDVRVAVPQSFKSRIFQTVEPTNEAQVLQIFRTFHLPKSQFLLRPFDLNLSSSPASIINVEYDPWCTIFWQALIARNRNNPSAKLVCSVKSNTYTDYPGVIGKLKHYITERGVRAVDCFLACGEKVAQIYRQQFGVPSEKILTCYHLGVDTDLFSPAESPKQVDPRRFIVGYCGRFDEDKGVIQLVEAVRTCRGILKADVQFYLLGKGRLTNVIDAYDSAHTWIHRFDPVPHDAVPDFLRQLDVFVLPSRITPQKEEHDAHALAEALSVGLPCIGTDSGIIPELLQGGAGTVAAANSIDALVEALVRMFKDSALRVKLQTKARKRAIETLSIQAVAQKKAALFHRLGGIRP